MYLLDLGLILNTTFCQTYKKVNDRSSPVMVVNKLDNNAMINLSITLAEIICYVVLKWEIGVLYWLIIFNLFGLVNVFGLLAVAKMKDVKDKEFLERILTKDSVILRYLFDKKFIFYHINQTLFAGLLIYIVLGGHYLVGGLLILIWYVGVILQARISDILKLKFYYHYMT